MCRLGVWLLSFSTSVRLRQVSVCVSAGPWCGYTTIISFILWLTSELLPVWGRRSQRDFFRGAAPFTRRPGIWKEVEPTGKSVIHREINFCKGPGAGRSSDFQRTERKRCGWCIKAFTSKPGVSSSLAMLFLNSLTPFFKLTS